MLKLKVQLVWITISGQIEAASMTVRNFFRGFWASL